MDRRWYRIADAIAVAGAGALIYATALARPMWVDEQMLALNVRDRALTGLAGALWLDQSAPLGWLAFESTAMRLFGTGEYAVRLLTVLFGIGTLAVAVAAGRRWLSPIGAAVLVALCASGEWLVFFTLELKHYSADACGALAIVALTAWVLEGSSDRESTARRVTLWWVAASAALWFSNGAMFVTPLCAIVLLAASARRGDWSAVRRHVAGGLLFCVSFAVDYAFVLRHALANAYLRQYWAFAFPPVSEGAAATIRWAGAQLESVARKPAGTELWTPFWVAWAGGVVFGFATGNPLALPVATIPVAAFGLAVLHVVPPFERLTVWTVPALYMGIALCADAIALMRSVRLQADRGRVRLKPDATSVSRVRLKPDTTYIRAVAGAGAAILATWVTVDVVHRGVRALANRPRSNYGLDDRRSVRWLMAEHQPGDAILTTHYGLAAIWWYGGVNIADGERSGRLSDGSPLFEITHVDSARECNAHERQLDAALSGHRRVAVYVGFRLNLEPPGFEKFVLDRLARRGRLVAYREYAEESRLALFDLTQRPGQVEDGTRPGCFAISPGRRW